MKKKINQFCNVNGHKMNPIAFLCMSKQCQFQSRWFCLQCIEDGIHYDHTRTSVNSLDNLLYKDNISKSLSQQKELLNEEKIMELQDAIRECDQLNIQIVQQKNEFQQLKNQIKNHQFRLKNYLQVLEDNNFINLDTSFINQINDINYVYYQNVFKDVQLYNYLRNNIEQKLGPQRNNKNSDQKQYIIQKIDSNQKEYWCSQISNDMRHLAYGGDDLNIYDLQQKKVIKKVQQLALSVKSCQFSVNSKQLYVSSKTNVFVYDVVKGFKQKYKLSIRGYAQIKNLFLIENHGMLTQNMHIIIKTDLKSKKIVFKITNSRGLIQVLDYNPFDNLLAIGDFYGTDPYSLRFWDCNKMALVIRKESNKAYQQVQFINCGRNVLILQSDGRLTKYKIDLIDKEIMEIQSYDYKNISSFQQVNQGQNLLLICKYCILILDNKGEVNQKVNHFEYEESQEESFQQYTNKHESKQLDNLQYVILRTKCKYLQHL